MTLKEALDQLSQSYPQSRVCIDVEVWKSHKGKPEVEYSAWTGSQNFYASSLELVIAKATDRGFTRDTEGAEQFAEEAAHV